MPRDPRRRGYTLTELLVVIAIILILISLMVPVFWQAIRKAQSVAGRGGHLYTLTALTSVPPLMFVVNTPHWPSGVTCTFGSQRA